MPASERKSIGITLSPMDFDRLTSFLTQEGYDSLSEFIHRILDAIPAVNVQKSLLMHEFTEKVNSLLHEQLTQQAELRRHEVSTGS